MKRQNYTQIVIPPRTSLDEAVELLQQFDSKGLKVYAKFNSHTFYSDDISLDSAYMQVFGRTRADVERARAKFFEEDEAGNAFFSPDPSTLSAKWIELGRNVLEAKFWGAWDSFVSKNSKSAFDELLLKDCLAVIKELNAGNLQAAICVFNLQEHVTGSALRVKNMICEFCSHGEKFIEALESKEKTSLFEQIQRCENKSQPNKNTSSFVKRHSRD